LAKGSGKCPGPVVVRGDGMGQEAPPAALSHDPTRATLWRGTRGPLRSLTRARGVHWPPPQHLRVSGSRAGGDGSVPRQPGLGTEPGRAQPGLCREGGTPGAAPGRAGVGRRGAAGATRAHSRQPVRMRWS